MGKKREIKYSKEALRSLAKELSQVRKPITEGAALSEVRVADIEDLEKAIRSLPEKKKKALEKFWGLAEGSVPYRERAKPLVKGNNKQINIAYWNMAGKVYESMRDLLELDRLYVYDSYFQELVKKILTKLDLSNAEEMDEMEAIKYLLIFFIFIMGGPLMIYEEEARSLGWEDEEIGSYDFYTLLETTWQSSISLMPDGNINMGLLKDIVEMFDIQDVCSMKRYVGLPVGKQNISISYTELETFKEIRSFKERIFAEGEWLTTELLIYNQGAKLIDLGPFAEATAELRNGDTEKYRTEDKTTEIEMSTGKKKLVYYQIGSMKFTDVYEMLSLYACRRALKA